MDDRDGGGADGQVDDGDGWKHGGPAEWMGIDRSTVGQRNRVGMHRSTMTLLA